MLHCNSPRCVLNQEGRGGDAQKIRVLPRRTSLKRMQSVGGLLSSLEKETFRRTSGNENDFFTTAMKALTDKLRSQSFLVSATRRRNDDQISHHSDNLIHTEMRPELHKTGINPLTDYFMFILRITCIDSIVPKLYNTRALFHYTFCCYNFANIYIFSTTYN